MSENTDKTEPKVSNPFFDAPNSKKFMVLIALFCAVFGQILHSATLSTLLPVAAAEIGGVEYYSLASTLGGVLSIAAMPLWGLLAARNASLKLPLFLVSLVAGVVAVLVRAFAPNMGVIVFTGILYGLVSPGIYVIGFVMVRDMFDSKKAAAYLGVIGTLQGAAMLIGPVAAGFIMDVAGWRIVCQIIWPFWAVACILLVMGCPRLTKDQSEALSRKGGSLDVSGTVAIMIFLSALMLAMSLGSSFIRWGTPLNWALWAVVVITLIWLIAVIKKKKADAVVPLPALKDRNTLSMALANFFANFSNMAVFFFVPTYCLFVLGSSAAEAGLATSMMSIVPLFMSPIWGRMIGKAASAKGVLAIGQGFRVGVCLGLLCLAAFGAPLVAFYVVLFFGGFYGSATSVGFSAGPQVQLREDIRIQGNSVIQMGQNLGGSIGTAFYTILIGMMGVGTGLFVAFGIAAAAALVALIFSLRLKPLNQ